MRTFKDYLLLRSAQTESERISLAWEIWDNVVWTPGFAASYDQTKRDITKWADALFYLNKCTYARMHGIKNLSLHEHQLRHQVHADMPKRMYGLYARARVKAALGAVTKTMQVMNSRPN